MSFGYAVLGAIVGSWFAGGTGAFIGGTIGAFLGNGDDKKKSASNAGASQSQGDGSYSRSFKNSENYMDCGELIFKCMGKLAKSDGVISREEADFAKKVLDDSKVSALQRRRLIEAFTAGRNSSESFRSLVQQLSRMLPRESCEDVMNIFCCIVTADDNITPDEIQFLRVAESVLHLPGYVDRIFREEENTGNHQSGDYSYSTQTDPLEESYKILGIPSTATDSEVKKAWHKKTLEFHPDKIQGKNLSEAFIRFATEETRRVNEAYKQICKSRGIN